MNLLNLDLAIKKKISLLNSIFKNYNIPINKNGELVYKCVNKNCNSHYKKKDKFCVNVYKESAHCWVCGVKYKNIDVLIKQLGSSDDIIIWNALKSNKGFDNKVYKKEEKVVYYDSFLNYMTPIFSLSTYHPARLYLKKRFIDLQTAWKFNMQFVSNLIIDNKKIYNCVCLPSHSLNGVDYLFFRSIMEDSNFKYNSKSPKSNIIFNDLYINWSKPICLTEGVFDAIRMFPYIQSIPILGSFLNYKTSILFQKIIQQRTPRIYICLDPEALKSQLKILDELFYWGIEVYSIVLDRTDLGASTEQEIQYAIKNAKLYSKNYKFEMLLR